MLPIPLASFSPDFKASKVRNHMSLTQFAFILESILPHGFFTVKTFWQQTDSISRKTHRSAALQRTGGLLQSFPLNSRGGLGGNIVDDAVDVGHLIDDADGDPVQHIVGDPGPVGGHEVRGGDTAEGQSIIIGPAIALHTYGAHIGQHREILAHGALQMRLGDLVPEDKIR